MSFAEGSPQTTINEVVYKLRPLPPPEALKHGTKLAAVLAGPAVQKAFSEFKLPDKDEENKWLAAIPALGNLVGEALKHLDKPEVQSALDALWGTAVIVHSDGREQELGPTWKGHFLGKTADMVAFLKWAAQEQYGDFFKAMLGSPLAALKERFGSLASLLQAKRPAASQST